MVTPTRSSPDPLSELEAGLHGALVRPGQNGYEEARAVWNGIIDKRPLAVARCSDVEDVVRAVDFARRYGWPLAVRGGGHNVAGLATSEGGLVLDLSAMNGVEVDPETRRARVQGGAIWRDVDAATQQYRLAAPAGLVSETGVAGLTLGGGIGWLRRKYGLSCDNLVAAELVTAAGERVLASERENPDLLWALRGGGGNFGVVTTFEFACTRWVLRSRARWSSMTVRRRCRACAAFVRWRGRCLRRSRRSCSPAPFRRARASPPRSSGKPMVAAAAVYVGAARRGRGAATLAA